MKILCVCQYFWPESVRVNDLCRGLKEQGHDVTVLTGIPNYPAGRFYEGYGWLKNRHQVWQGINIIRASLIPRGKSKSLNLIMNYLSFVFFGLLTVLRLTISRQRFDVIFVYQLSPITMAIPAILLKRILGLPMVLYVLDLWPDSLRVAKAIHIKGIFRMVQWLSMCIYKQSDKILASSAGFINQLISRGVLPEYLEYYPQWAEDIYHDKQVAISGDFEFKTEEFYIVFAGNIGEAQDFETVINAALVLKDYKNIHLVILGDGRKKDWLEEQVKNNKLESNIHLLGRKPVESIPFYFSKADALLVTLIDDEVLSLTVPAKVQSYLASGKPIIGALSGEGAKIIEQSGAGVSCIPGDATGLANIILKIYSMSEDDRNAMGAQGKKYVKEYFNREKLLNHLQDIFYAAVKVEANANKLNFTKRDESC